MLTIEQVQAALPANLKGAATQQLTDQINTIVSDPVIAENIRNNFISYTSVMKDGRFKTSDYLNAVVWVSFKLMGYSNIEVYQRTFPQRYQDLLAKGTSSKDIAAYVSAYARNKLVNAIMEQTLVPSWVLNQDIHQKAINVLADLMVNANSEKVQAEAASSLLTHLAKPKEAGPLVAINVEQNNGVKDLQDQLRQIAKTQQQLITDGVPTHEIAGMKLIEKREPEPAPADGVVIDQ